MTAPLNTAAQSADEIIGARSPAEQRQLNAQAADALVTHAWRGGTWGNYWTNTPVPGGEPVKRTHWTPVQERRPWPGGFTNLYFGLHPSIEIPPTIAGKSTPAKPQYVRTQYKYIAAVNLFFAEFDSKDNSGADCWPLVLALAPPPTLVTRSSPGCYHCFWLLVDTFCIGSPDDLERAKQAQAGWVNRAGSDKCAKDLARVLRVPGSMNLKPERQQADGSYPAVDVVLYHPGQLYTFEELEALALPHLTAAEKERSARRTAGAGHVVTLDGAATITPALQAQLDRLPQVMLDKLHDPGAQGKRSERDYSVVADLVREGFTDADILGTFANYPIGTAGKFSEAGPRYLARTIERVRDAVQPAGPDIPTSALLALARRFVSSGEGITYLRERGDKRAAGTLHMLAALVNLAHEHNSISFATSLGSMVKAANLSKAAVWRRLKKLAALDIVTVQSNTGGTLVTLSIALRLAADSSLFKSETPSITVDSVSLLNSDDGGVDLAEHWQACNVANDLYTAVQYRHGIARRRHKHTRLLVAVRSRYSVLTPQEAKRRRAGRASLDGFSTVLLPSLGPATLHVVRELRRGPASVVDLADVTGLSVQSVKREALRLQRLGLAYVAANVGRQHENVWALVEDYDDRAASITPETTTAGNGLRNAELFDRIAAVRLHDKMHFEADPAERLRLRNNWQKAERVAQMRRDLLAAIGIKPAKASSKPRPFMRWDKKEQDAEHRHAWEAWRDTRGLEHAERCRMMQAAGYSESDIQAAMKIDRWGDDLAPAADFMDDPAPDAVVVDSCAERPQEAWGWA